MKALYLFCLILFSSVFSYAQDSPIAVNDTVIANSPGVFEVSVLDNDYDPNDETIYLDHIYSNSYYDIEQDGNKIIISPHSYGIFQKSIKYKIRNESGKHDKAEIVFMFVADENAPQLNSETLLVESQVAYTIDLLDNDIYTGSQEIAIYNVWQPRKGHVEVLEDGHSIKYTADAYSGGDYFQYSVIEQGGDELLSYHCMNKVFIESNPDEPIAVADTFYIEEEQSVLFDVMQNDSPSSSISLFSVSPDNYASIENGKIRYNAPLNKFGHFQFSYTIIDSENDLKSVTVRVHVMVHPDPNRPIAVLDTIEFIYQDAQMALMPLGNDISSTGNALKIWGNDNDTAIMFDQHIDKGNGWYRIKYRCQDTETLKVSPYAYIHVHVLPPIGIQIEDQYLTYRIGDTLRIDAFANTNLPDTLSIHLSSKLGRAITYTRSYYFDFLDYENLAHQYYHGQYSLADTIEIKYNLPQSSTPNYCKSYIYLTYENADISSDLQVNNINIKVTPQGIDYGGAEYPKNSGLSPIFNIQHWLLDDTDMTDLKVSGDVNYYDGRDFVSGPLVDDYSGDYYTNTFRTWTITKQEIETHKWHYYEPDYIIPEAILNWPSNHTVYQGIEYEAADFIDTDNNGSYDPENGDYPKIVGDQAVLYVLNDGHYPNYADGRLKDSLNVDVYALVYAFDTPESELFQNTFFIKYKIINKSDLDYENFKFGMYAYFDFANNYDGYTNRLNIACDTNLNTFYAYPGMYYDAAPFWNKKPPISTVTFLNRNMDKFTQVNTIFSTYMDPIDNYSYLKKMHYMNGTWDDALWRPTPSWTANAPLDYVYPSNPGIIGGDSELQAGSHYLTDREGVGTSGPLYFGQGEVLEYELAYHYSYTSDSGYFESIDQALDEVNQLLICYQNDSIPGGGSFSLIPENMDINDIDVQIYPNPVYAYLNIKTAYAGFETYRIFNGYGQLIEDEKFTKHIFMAPLQNGIYFLQLLDDKGDVISTRKFIKQ